MQTQETISKNRKSCFSFFMLNIGLFIVSMGISGIIGSFGLGVVLLGVQFVVNAALAGTGWIDLDAIVSAIED